MLMIILIKDGKYTHTVSRAKSDRLVAQGWKVVVGLSGWNISISYGKEIERERG